METRPSETIKDHESLRALEKRWKNSGAKSLPERASIEEIVEFEERYRISLPQLMTDYFLMMNGNGDWMNDMFRFWRLQELEPVNPKDAKGWDSTNCFLFCDYGIRCWAYAIRLTESPDDSGPIYLVGTDHKIIVAPSFLESIERYLADDDSL